MHSDLKESHCVLQAGFAVANQEGGDQLLQAHAPVVSSLISFFSTGRN